MIANKWDGLCACACASVSALQIFAQSRIVPACARFGRSISTFYVMLMLRILNQPISSSQASVITNHTALHKWWQPEQIHANAALHNSLHTHAHILYHLKGKYFRQHFKCHEFRKLVSCLLAWSGVLTRENFVAEALR